ncbi:MAG TPA: DUF5686 family protein, partial [Chitinophagaceae bacterium]|nr:DUF5686 family protein [Chitinophagaceae bacterium]
PFSSVQFKGTTVGTSTDENGNFVLKLDFFPGDTLLVRTIGYQTLYIAIDKKKKKQTLTLDLIRQNYKLDKFTIHAGVNPALNMLRKIIERKPINNPEKIASYSERVYNKLEFDLTQLDQEKIKHSKLLKPFAFILKNLDSTTEGKVFLPVFLTETISDFYYQKNPKKQKEIIRASHRSGVKNKSFTQFLGNMYQKINVYNNFISVFGKQFPSPINDNATLYYEYRMVDTQYIDQKLCFQIAFKPKHKAGQYFFGDFWVNDTSYAIKKMNLQVSKDANINFVHKINLIQEFQLLKDSVWFPVENKIVADFIPVGEKNPGFIGRKTTQYYDVQIDDPKVKAVINAKKYRGNNIFVMSHASDKTDSFWVNHRYVNLSENERAIYSMMDTLENMPLYHKYVNIIKFATTGTKAFGPIEIGPYYYFISGNQREKIRLRMDLGTTTDLFKDVYLHGYLAYGFGDHQYKGGLSGLWLLKRRPRMYLYASYIHDLDNGGRGKDIGTDNIFSLAIRKNGIPQKFVMEEERRLEFYKEWFNGFSLHGMFTNKKYNPFAPLPLKTDYNITKSAFDFFNNSEISLSARFAWKEKFLEGDYKRISLGSKYPIIELTGAVGVKGILNSSYQYQKLKASISDKWPIPPLGQLKYNIYGGKIWGQLPYLLLKIHQGNELYYYNAHAFNMMNRYEFLSDEWFGVNIEHDIGGGIFNYIPLLKKLKLRQFWTAKFVVGRLSDQNKKLNFGHGYQFHTLAGNPYLEIGTGVENILHFIRVDLVWRVLPNNGLNVPLSKKFGIFGSFKLTF